MNDSAYQYRDIVQETQQKRVSSRASFYVTTISFAVFALSAALLPFRNTLFGDLFPTQESSALDLGLTFQEVAPSISYATIFEQQTGIAANPDYFGAWTMHPAGNELYVGHGTARPVESDGALLGAIDENLHYSPIGTLDEQGVHEVDHNPVNNMLYILGSDPAFADGHEAGNVYTYDVTQFPTNTLLKKRNPEDGLVNVFHAWGQTVVDQDTWYVAASSHNGQYTNNCSPLGEVCFGEIFRSNDNGTSWQSLAKIGNYRAYDIAYGHGKLYALAQDWPNALTGYISTDEGTTWNDVPDLHQVLDKDRILTTDTETIFVAKTRNELYALQTDGSVLIHKLPFNIGTSAFNTSYFNTMTQDADFLYTMSDTGELYMAHTPDTWIEAAQSDMQPLAMAYWPTKDALMVSDHGVTGSIWKVDLASLDPIIVGFYANTPLTVAGQEMQFFDTTYHPTDTVTSWAWDFTNDGTTDSTEQNPMFTFTPEHSGLQTVALTITTDGGYTETLTKENYIEVSAPFDPGFDIQSSGYRQAAEMEIVQFVDTTRVISQEPIQTWEWDLDGNGTIDSTTQNPTHQYSETGTYTVTLTVRNSYGFASISKDITILDALTPSMAADPRTGTPPFSVQFTDTSINRTQTPISSWQWDLDGDGVVDSTEQNPSFTYTQIDTYDVSVTISNGDFTETITNPAYINVPRFTDISQSAGITHTIASYSSAWSDINGDGRLDIMVGHRETDPAKVGPNLVYLQQPDRTFALDTGIAAQFEPNTFYSTTHTAWFDADNDFDTDLFMTNMIYADYHQLFVNQNATYTFVNTPPLTEHNSHSYGAAIADYNNDRLLDIFIPNDAGWTDKLFKNTSIEGALSFAEVTNVPVTTANGSASDANWVDHDNDGDMDLFVINTSYQQPNRLYNNDGAGSLTPVNAEPFISDTALYMSAAWGDYDNDQDLDLFLSGGEPAIYNNKGNSVFVKTTDIGIPNSLPGTRSASWMDHDNDGDLDLFTFASGVYKSAIFINNGDGTFTHKTHSIFTGKDTSDDGASWADYDQDGDMDMYVNTWTNADPDVLYQNQTNSAASLRIRLIGTLSNSQGIGAHVVVQSHNPSDSSQMLTQMRERTVSQTTGTQDEGVLHFGLGAYTSIDSITVHWPSGHSQTIAGKQYALPINLVITEEEVILPTPTTAPEPTPTIAYCNPIEDVSCNGIVNMKDYGLIYLNIDSAALQYDVDQSQYVDALDLVKMLNAYGKTN